jgi:hypothetical protein
LRSTWCGSDPHEFKLEQPIIQVEGSKDWWQGLARPARRAGPGKGGDGVLISLQPPTGPMEAEAASAGFYAHKMNGQQYPQRQLRTVKELMEGKGIERPSNVAAVDETFKKAPESKKKLGHQKEFVQEGAGVQEEAGAPEGVRAVEWVAGGPAWSGFWPTSGSVAGGRTRLLFEDSTAK